MSNKLNQAILRVAKANPEFRRALQAELKTAKHRAGVPPYGSWHNFIETLEYDSSPSPSNQPWGRDIEHALRELRNYASYDSPWEWTGDGPALKNAIAKLEHLQKMLKLYDAAWDKWDAALRDARRALQKAGQL
jgi:hypothetical protein